MKANSVRCIFIVCITIFGVASCKEDTKISNPTEKLDSIIDPVKIQVIDGMLVFDSVQTVFSTISMLDRMEEIDRIQWEKSLGFISFRSLANDAMLQLAKAKTEYEYNEIFMKNSSILKIVDEYIDPIIESTAYSGIANKDGNFMVGTSLHHVDSDEIVIYKENPEGVKSHQEPVRYSLKDNLIESKSFLHCGSSIHDQERVDDRELTLTLYLEKYIIVNDFKWRYTIKCKGQMHKLFGYSDYHSVYKIIHSYVIIQQIPIATGYYANGVPWVYYGTAQIEFSTPEFSSPELVTKTWSWDVGYNAPQELVLKPASFCFVVCEATSRGIYPNVCSIMCDHREQSPYYPEG